MSQEEESTSEVERAEADDSGVRRRAVGEAKRGELEAVAADGNGEENHVAVGRERRNPKPEILRPRLDRQHRFRPTVRAHAP